MAKDTWREVKRIFGEALEIADDEKESFIKAESDGNQHILDQLHDLLEVNEVLQTHGVHHSFMENGQLPAIGLKFGPYQIVKHLGKGGMGDVFLAEQTKPVVRQVALKLVYLTGDKESLASRFETERQSLALMNHPGIATFFQAGFQDGQPFFAMEYVPGKPITSMCDQYKLSLEERLKLYIQVCSAVQHAHQKGIIHRDIKPSNVLLMEQGTQFHPKIIDFGIAKTISEMSDVQNTMTREGTILGTPAYMSPEQAQGQTDIDTRTDVYALGLLLYELCVGLLPVEFKDVSIFEVLNTILHKEYPSPCQRLDEQSKDERNILAQHRGLTASHHYKVLSSEITWILNKAMHKDRTRRYATANELMTDIQAYLTNRPVTAGPPSNRYLISKWIKRHRSAFTAGVVSLTAVVLGLFLATMGYIEAVKSKRHAILEAEKSNAISEFLQTMLRSPNPNEDGRDVKVIDLLESAETSLMEQPPASPEVELSIANTLSNTYLQLGLLPESESVARKAFDKAKQIYESDEAPLAEAQSMLGEVYTAQHRLDEALPLLEQALLTLREQLGEKADATRLAMSILANIYDEMGELEKALPLIESVYFWELEDKGAENKSTLAYQSNYCRCLADMDLIEKAENCFRKNLETSRRVLGSDHTQTINILNHMAIFYVGRKSEKAIKLAEEAYDLSLNNLGPEDLLTLTLLHNLAYFHEVNNQPAQAVPIYQKVLGMQAVAWGKDSLDEIHSESYLLRSLYDSGQLDALYKQSKSRLEYGKPENPEIWGALAKYFALTNHFEEARRAWEIGNEAAPDDLCLMLAHAVILNQEKQRSSAEEILSNIAEKEWYPGQVAEELDSFQDLIPSHWTKILLK